MDSNTGILETVSFFTMFIMIFYINCSRLIVCNSMGHSYGTTVTKRLTRFMSVGEKLSEICLIYHVELIVIYFRTFVMIVHQMNNCIFVLYLYVEV